MSPPKAHKEAPPANAAAQASGRNCSSALPDNVLQHMLSFLPAHDAVRTCVFAKSWRHIWNFTTGLLIACGGETEPASGMPSLVRAFVEINNYARDSRVLSRDFDCYALDDEDNRCVLLKRLSEAQNLALIPHDIGKRHLTRLELDGMELSNSFFDFSSCPSLEHLEIASCDLWETNMIMSESLKRLSITNCLFGKRFRTHVNVPNLVSLRLDSHLYRAPVIERMPTLQEEYVRVGHENSNSADCDDEDCYSCHGALRGDNKKCVLLECLSEAENMALISESKTFIFGRDLNKCPIFSKIKTLLLNVSWCVAPDFPALSCILKNTPVLGKLTLQLFSKGPKHKVEMIGRFNSMERSAVISEHLKAIRIKCEVVDEEVTEILKFLCTLNICFIFK
ncbi:unnamed protein product [Urochloa decumbens]|uniref:F-box domain-containing protein n=1 Tax=Urochloa decumbens TaxID=240449 RepID=A0ABC9AQW4_9POAL